jgi:hypothetical protein
MCLREDNENVHSAVPQGETRLAIGIGRPMKHMTEETTIGNL